MRTNVRSVILAAVIAFIPATAGNGGNLLIEEPPLPIPEEVLVVVPEVDERQLNTQVELSLNEVEQLIIDTAIKYGINADQFLATAECESGFKTDAIGDYGNSHGVFQIHLPSHPTVTKELAHDPYFNIEWSAQKWVLNPKIWTCYRLLYVYPYINSVSDVKGNDPESGAELQDSDVVDDGVQVAEERSEDYQRADES